MEQIMNHRERRALAKRRAKSETCSRHPGTRLIIKGTQIMCPKCYYELVTAKMKLKLALTKKVELSEEQTQALEKEGVKP